MVSKHWFILVNSSTISKEKHHLPLFTEQPMRAPTVLQKKCENSLSEAYIFTQPSIVWHSHWHSRSLLVSFDFNLMIIYAGSEKTAKLMIYLTHHSIVEWQDQRMSMYWYSESVTNISEFRNESFIPHNYHSPMM